MREIKFRAWDKVHKKMEYGTKPYIYYTASERSISIGFNLHQDFYHKNNEVTFENALILMQYTGLKDKNGKEIYEGDIVEECERHWCDANPDMHSNMGVVQYIAPRFYAYYDKQLPNPICSCGGGTDPSLSCKIIGNIYENPDLFET